jgi:O-antigen ligase
MGSILHLLLAFGALVYFISMLFFSSNDRNKTYLQSVLFIYPLLAIDLTPALVSMSIFVFISVVFLLFFYQRKTVDYSSKKIFSGLSYVFLLVVLAGLYLADDIGKDSITSFTEITAIFFFAKVLIEECLYDLVFYDRIKKILKFTVLVSLVFLVVQINVGPAFSIAKSQNINVISGIKVRYTSFFQDPQKFAQFLAASSFLFLLPAAHSYKRQHKAILLFLITVTAIFFTGGRSALGGWLLAMFLIVLCSNARFRLAFFLIFGILFFVAYYYADSFALFQRESTVADAYAFRYEIWKDAFGIFSEYPIFGIGSGNYANYVSLYHPDQFWIADNEVTYFDHPESGYLKLLVEYGAVGFIILMSFILIPTANIVRLYLTTRRTAYVLPLASILSWMIGFYTVHSLGDIRIFVLVVSLICMLIVDHEIYAVSIANKGIIQTV